MKDEKPIQDPLPIEIPPTDLTTFNKMVALRRKLGPEKFRAMMASKREAAAARIRKQTAEIRANDNGD